MEDLIHKFYNAFNDLDFQTMASCYHDDIIFEDAAFGILKGKEAKYMWHMLCASQKGKDFKVTHSDVLVSTNRGKCDWEAHYTFSKTGRRVHNKIKAEFKFKDGLIIQHRDQFNLYGWARQALGITGWLIGFTKFFKNKLQNETRKKLSNFIKKTDFTN